ncbi:MAG TPA: response regulator [Elusimicrobiota bacterium]|jgi:CheY-like chemotaxis protein|nr:response regulator [Elusimicrobiota bacterium]
MKPLVLVVDEDAGWRGLASSILEPEFRVLCLPSASEAMEACWTEAPRVLLCDIALANSPGIEMLRRLQEDPRRHGIAVVLSTDNAKLAQQPADAFPPIVRAVLRKPCPQKDLLDAVRAAAAGRKPDGAPSGKREYKVVIADDQGNFLQFLDLVIKQLGDGSRSVVYHKARNGTEALELARRHKPDLIVSDMMMPGMTGVEFLRELGKEPGLKKIPSILMTANRMPPQQKDVLLRDIPALKYILEKPCSLDVVRAAMETLLRENE